MKTILKKYKIPLIRGGALLGIVVLLLIANSNSLKQNTNKDEAKSREVSETGTIRDNQIGENKQIRESNQTEKDEIVENQDTENENVDKEEKDIDDVKGSANKGDEDTYASKGSDSTKIKKETKPAQVKKTEPVQTKKTGTVQAKNTNNNSSSSITGEKYTVKKGDTLFSIAQKANISVDYLMELNNLNSDVIYENQTLKIKGSASNSSNRVASRGGERSEDLYWLSRIIHSEAQGEPYKGKVAVGNVIMNRVNSGSFPNTVKEVVFDKQDGYTQFSPVLDGTIYNTPDTQSVEAAREILNGARPVGNALYFLNPRESTNFWITKNRKYMTTIGLHDFYY